MGLITQINPSGVFFGISNTMDDWNPISSEWQHIPVPSPNERNMLILYVGPAPHSAHLLIDCIFSRARWQESPWTIWHSPIASKSLKDLVKLIATYFSEHLSA